MFDEKIMELELAGRTLKVSTGKISRQSSGAIVIQYGDTVVLSTANRSKEARKGADFFPLTVDYIEKFYSLELFNHLLKLSAVRKVLETLLFLALGSFETLGSKLSHGTS